MARKSEEAIALLNELKEFEDWLGMSGLPGRRRMSGGWLTANRAVNRTLRGRFAPLFSYRKAAILSL